VLLRWARRRLGETEAAFVDRVVEELMGAP
jgi:hypothetical protein